MIRSELDVLLDNTQKLSKSSRLVQGGTNAREFSFWDILRNTIRGDATDLVLVLDEAHRGMKRIGEGRRRSDPSSPPARSGAAGPSPREPVTS